MRPFVAALLIATPIAGTGRQLPGQARSASWAADSTAVVAVAEGLVHAISERDTAMARRLMMPGATLVSIPDPSSASDAGRTQSDSAFYRSLSSAGPRFLERIWTPSVWIHGPLAVVRAPYDFFRDGVFSHCGVDIFTMVRSRGEWRISHVVYTTQRAHCGASPLGPPTS